MFNFTPREMEGWLFLAGKRHLRDQLIGLQREAMAAQGDPKAIKKQIRDLKKEL